ncbi:MAG: methionyl-tRNA formyltransferase [Phycisphaerae bacterium]|jgi:methionyl-tRNA formyltransferase
MRLTFWGTGEFGGPALRALHAAGHEIVRVISQPDRPAGRGMAVRPTPIHALAAELGLPHVQSEDVNAIPPAELIGSAELGVVVAFGQKLGPRLLHASPRGFVNIHASLLPKYRGAAPIQWAIIEGESTTGVTVFQLDERWDAGAVWGRRTTPIGETETAGELHDRLAALGAELIVKVVTAIHRGTIQPVPQDPSQATRAPKLTPAHRRLDLAQPAARVARRINGLWPWPAATCRLSRPDGSALRVQLARARVAADAAPQPAPHEPGEFCSDGSVQTAEGRIRILEIKPAGRGLMSFEDFARGHLVTPPARLLPLDEP